MNPYLELVKMLQAKQAPRSGTIVSIAGSQIQVRTSKALIEVRSVDAMIYKVGDEVLFKDGIINGKVKPLSEVPVYNA